MGEGGEESPIPRLIRITTSWTRLLINQENASEDAAKFHASLLTGATGAPDLSARVSRIFSRSREENNAPDGGSKLNRNFRGPPPRNDEECTLSNGT